MNSYWLLLAAQGGLLFERVSHMPVRLFPGSNKWLSFLRVSSVSSLKNIVSIHTQAQKYLIIK